MTVHTVDEIIEAMARALCAIDKFDWDALADEFRIMQPGKDHYRKCARAAYAECLRMLREPTRRMRESGSPRWMTNDQEEAARSTWQAMIDARIKELG